MARPPKTRPPEETDGIAAANIDHQALESAGHAMTQHSQDLRVIDMQFAVDGDYDYHRIDSMTPAAVQMYGSSGIWLGRAMNLIKEHEAKGALTAYLQKHGLQERSARRLMAAARRFGSSDERKLLAGRLGISKAIELMSEDDDTLDALEGGGTLAGLTLDAIDRMTVRELKATLRAEREERADEKAADEEIIAKKDERINKLSRRSTRSAAREQVSELLTDLDKYTVEAATFIKHMRDTIGAINAVYDDAKEQMDEEVTQRIETNLSSASEWSHQLATELGE